MANEDGTASPNPGEVPNAPPTIDCHTAAVHMWPYLDRELTRPHQRAVTMHLAKCTHCRGQFDFNRTFLRAVRSSLRRLIRREPWYEYR